ncbi:4377_t:CDS:10 [Funneliformis caledonium]|uniref:4377_t:CDS:1 n=1 Tax=Funneliformis caledonium TaxID=1117310 RepID=A0A9N9E001_9GLOM|nr:4377_t:CDS:10 [Funneliformis caledonium]
MSSKINKTKRLRRIKDKEKIEMARHSFIQLRSSNKEKSIANSKQRMFMNKEVEQSTNKKRRQSISTDEEDFDSSEDEDQITLNIFNTPKDEFDQILANLETKSHLERYNVICLFDVEFPYSKKLFTVLSTGQMQKLKNEWIEAEKSVRQETIQESWNKCTLKKQVDEYLKILEEKMDNTTFYIDFNELFTAFMKQPSNEYQHRSNYELFWTHQFLRNRSVLKDKTASEFRYRDELVNHLLSTIFYDVEDAIWIDTGEIENGTRKRQRNFSKTDNEREKLGDKHDGVIYMNVHGSKVEVGFFEVVGNALINNNNFKNDDLTKLLKAMMISLRYQYAYSKNASSLQSFSILVYGCEYHFLSMHLINNMYVVDEFDAFILPNSSVCFSEIGNAVEVIKKFKLRMTMYYRYLINSPRKATWLTSIDLPTASPSNPKKQSLNKDYEEQVKYNNDGSVNVPFGRAAEWYLANLPILENCRLKNQSRQITPALIKAGIITIERVQGAVDYLE